MTQRTSIMITAQAKAGYLVVRTEAPDRRGRARGMSSEGTVRKRIAQDGGCLDSDVWQCEPRSLGRGVLPEV